MDGAQVDIHTPLSDAFLSMYRRADLGLTASATESLLDDHITGFAALGR